jgi:cell division transport system permease protein
VKPRSARRALRGWGRRQLYSFFSSLGTLLGHRLGTLMTVMVLGIAMSLPLGLYVTVKNVRAVDLKQRDWGTLTVFLEPDLGRQDAESLAARIVGSGLGTATTVSPDEGLEQFQEASGFGRALELFEDNPLPWVILAAPLVDQSGDVDAAVSALAGWLEQQDEVDIVQVDHKWLQRLAGLLQLGDAVVTVLAVLFSLAVVVVVANTIRMDVAGRADEIQVLSLVGAGNGFIRQPFLYSGFWYGLLGALLALILLFLTLFYLALPLERLLAAYGSRFELQTIGLPGVLLVLLGGGLLGLFGAWMSVQRYLRQLRATGLLGRR